MRVTIYFTHVTMVCVNMRDMNIHYSRTDLPVSIFLAGPTPRSPEVKSWRPEAISIFERFKFDGSLVVPEDATFSPKFDYNDQIEWELQGLHAATVVLFWVPRSDDMPALTTNVEFGLMATRRNVVIGCPDDAPKMKYLRGIAALYGLGKVHSTLDQTVFASIVKSVRPFQTS